MKKNTPLVFLILLLSTACSTPQKERQTQTPSSSQLQQFAPTVIGDSATTTQPIKEEEGTTLKNQSQETTHQASPPVESLW
ncbi:MAG: hypothetical protein WA919_12115 [Coleofasciculaceae cyanobacterium]